MLFIPIVVLLIFVFSFIVSLGFLNAYNQWTQHRLKDAEGIKEDYRFALAMALCCGVLGPLGIIVAYSMTQTGLYGFKLLPAKKNK
jgi:hypothetical protein